MTVALSTARWLPASTDARIQTAIRRAIVDIGLCEMPPGSNRSGVLDDYARRSGSPVGSFWCGIAVGTWWQDAGLDTPPWYGSCDNWVRWAKRTDRWVPVGQTPPLGGAVLYGKPEDAQHIGLVVRVTPLILSVEGNTTVEGAGFGASRNGVAVSLKEVTPGKDPVLGYVAPLPRVVVR